MALACNESQALWTLDEDGKTPTLTIIGKLQTHIVPWHLFVSAQGTDGNVSITFHSHVIRIEGAGLTELLEAVASHSVSSLTEPDRAALFRDTGGKPIITSLSVSPNEG